MFDSREEALVHSPPSSLVPRIHCLTYRKLNFYNPLLPPFPQHISTGTSFLKYWVMSRSLWHFLILNGEHERCIFVVATWTRINHLFLLALVSLRSQIPQLRECLIDLLSSVVFNDRLAANYILANILSKMFVSLNHRKRPHELNSHYTM